MGGCICNKSKPIEVKRSGQSNTAKNNVNEVLSNAKLDKRVTTDQILSDSQPRGNSREVRKTTNDFEKYETIRYNKVQDFKLWVIVLDFLPKRDLYEVGKVNRAFNSVSKSGQLLVKFFRNNKTLDVRVQEHVEKSKLSIPSVVDRINTISRDRLGKQTSIKTTSEGTGSQSINELTKNVQIVNSSNISNNFNTITNKAYNYQDDKNSSVGLMKVWSSTNLPPIVEEKSVSGNPNQSKAYKEIKIVTMELKDFETNNFFQNSNNSFTSNTSSINTVIEQLTSRSKSIDFSLNSHPIHSDVSFRQMNMSQDLSGDEYEPVPPSAAESNNNSVYEKRISSSKEYGEDIPLNYDIKSSLFNNPQTCSNCSKPSKESKTPNLNLKNINEYQVENQSRNTQPSFKAPTYIQSTNIYNYHTYVINK